MVFYFCMIFYIYIILYNVIYLYCFLYLYGIIGLYSFLYLYNFYVIFFIFIHTHLNEFQNWSMACSPSKYWLILKLSQLYFVALAGKNKGKKWNCRGKMLIFPAWRSCFQFGNAVGLSLVLWGWEKGCWDLAVPAAIPEIIWEAGDVFFLILCVVSVSPPPSRNCSLRLSWGGGFPCQNNF